MNWEGERDGSQAGLSFVTAKKKGSEIDHDEVSASQVIASFGFRREVRTTQ
jgi:hypothetical protein